MLKTIFYSLAALVRKILFSPLENNIHIFAPPSNILYICFIMIASSDTVLCIPYFFFSGLATICFSGFKKSIGINGLMRFIHQVWPHLIFLEVFHHLFNILGLASENETKHVCTASSNIVHASSSGSLTCSNTF